MELENMKKKLLAILLFFSIFISGCSGDDLPSITTEQTNPSSVTKEAPTTTENNQDKQDKQDKTETLENKGKDNPKEQNPDQDKPNKDTNQKEETTDPEEGEDPSTTEDPNKKNSTEKPEDSPNVKTPATEPKPAPEPEPKSFFDNISPITLGIIAALVVIVLILIWLLYDRRKMKTTLKNLNNPPPKTNPPPQTDTPPQSVNTLPPQPPINEQLTIRVDNLQNIGARKEQQDSFCVSNISDSRAISEKGLMAVVADGMGGLEGGALISRLVTETFLNNYNNQFNFEPTAFLYNTAESSERAVEDYMKQTGINGGSTLVAVIIKGGQMNFVSVGDSHIYLLRDNMLTLINKEHNFGALLKEQADRGEVDPREPYINPKRNALTAYIGMGSFNTVDKNDQPIILKSGDKILLCSDGVYNALGDNELIVALAGDVRTATKKLEQDILSQNIPSQDNFTAVILECI